MQVTLVRRFELTQLSKHVVGLASLDKDSHYPEIELHMVSKRGSKLATINNIVHGFLLFNQWESLAASKAIMVLQFLFGFITLSHQLK